MSKRKSMMGILTLMLLFVFSGCSKAGRYDDFTKEEQALSFQTKRKQTFGNSDYSKIATEKEAFQLVEEKYKLGIPAYYEETKELIANEIPSDTVKPGETLYAVFARNKELNFQTRYTFYKEEELQVVSEVSLNYEYSEENNLAYLRSQTVSIKIAPVNGGLPNDNLNRLVEKIGTNMNISNEKIMSGLAGYEKQVKESTSPITEEFLPIITSQKRANKNEAFNKLIAVGYDTNGTVRELYAEISE
ncbi:hypothetical protein [Enterococcus ureasiticus]|uniref:Lipoprotein n=1 Tax=Enterococcus ureasiticus TaxID=903984 RepID=A0A1E5G9Z5_9ENTE|nr:hypothetical protein [Enterococcus ureasiticus]OEG09536.1 hypothetical protein BCR21_14385 [Enterococcus ureasiticus]